MEKKEREREDCSHFSLFLSALFVFFFSFFSCAHLGMSNERVGRFSVRVGSNATIWDIVRVCLCLCVRIQTEKRLRFSSLSLHFRTKERDREKGNERKWMDDRERLLFCDDGEERGTCASLFPNCFFAIHPFN